MRMIIDVKTTEHTKGLKELLLENNVKINGFFKWLLENPEIVEEICKEIPEDINYRWKKNLKEND